MKLQLGEPRVEAAGGGKCLVRAFFDDAALIEDQDAVAGQDSRQPMRDHDGGALAHQLGKRGGNLRLAFGIERMHNAIKFTPPEGRITVSARPLLEQSRVELVVRDTGIGIRPEDLPRIFERFWKADSSRQRDGEGSGLGLAIARHVVEAHGGSIRVVSEPRRGATFIVELPAAPATPPEPEAG